MSTKYAVLEPTPEQEARMTEWELPPDIHEAHKAIASVVLNVIKTRLTKEDMLPGDILVRYEPFPETDSHARTQNIQYSRPILNGMPNNKEHNLGDYRNVHGLVWVKTPGNPGNTEPYGEGDKFGEPEVVDARGGLDAEVGKRIFRVQGTALQAGRYKVFRPVDKDLAYASAQILTIWGSAGNIPYSISQLSEMGKAQSFMEWSDQALAEALEYARGAYDKYPEWAGNDPDEEVLKKLEGAMCTNLVVIGLQAAGIQIHAHRELERRKLDPQEIEANEKTDIFTEATESFEGLLKKRARGHSPRTFEHHLHTAMFTDKDGSVIPQFHPMGTLVIAEEDVLYEERPYPTAPNIALAERTSTLFVPRLPSARIQDGAKRISTLDADDIEQMSAVRELVERRNSPVGDDDIGITTTPEMAQGAFDK
jgi:hypothetical protein